MSDISVILCTHNPRRDYLTRTLDALRDQTLPTSEWELVIIDNCSEPPLRLIDLSWHPSGRIIREDELGLTAARLRGIRETKADLIVFVDDDNVLDPEYLENASVIAQSWPMLGVWGGRIVPEFETTPPDWVRKYVELLAIREFHKDRWSNVYDEGHLPCGAGMCVRRNVTDVYASELVTQPIRKLLGRRGKSLMSCEDYDLGYTACDVGMGVGQFISLELTHLIPSSRLNLNHLVNLREKASYSISLLSRIRGLNYTAPSFPRRVVSIVKSIRGSRIDRAMLRADMRGRLLAAKVPIESLGRETHPQVATATA